MPRPVARLLSMLAALALALLWVALSPGAASACSCQGGSRASAARQADAIFTGTVTKKSTLHRPAPGRTDIRFEVTRVYKGTVYAEQVVASPLPNEGCGLDPQVHSSWLIFAEDDVEGSGDTAVYRLVTRLCSGDLPSAQAPVYLGPGQAPLTGASDREENAVVADGRVNRVLEVGAGVVAALALLAGAALAYLWRPGPSDD